MLRSLEARRWTSSWALPAVGVCLVSLWRVREFVTDDAAITLRYAYHLSVGEGIRWNPGEDPVEGYSNFLHVLLGAAALKVGLPALGTLRFVNQLSAVALCGMTYVLGLRTLGSSAWAAVAALLVAVHAPFAYWASSGLETSLYTALAYGGLLLWQRGAPPMGLALVFSLAALTRFEGPVMAAVVVGAIVAEAIQHRTVAVIRRNAAWIGTFTLGYGIYFAWRYFYFGYPLPSSAYYKQNAGDEHVVIMEFARQCGHLLVLALFARFRVLGSFGLVLAAIVVLYAVGFRNVAPSVSTFHRFLLPVVPALALLATSALERLWRTPSWRPAVWRSASLVMAACLFAVEVLHPQSGWERVRANAERIGSRIGSRAATAAWIAAHVPATHSVMLGDVGTVGYVLRHRIVDLFGLNDEAFAHRFRRNRRAYATQRLHESPTVVVVVSKSTHELEPRYATERRVVADPLFSEAYTLREVVRSPVEPYHYWIYVRRELHTARDVPPLAFDVSHDVAGQVDALSRRAHATF